MEKIQYKITNITKRPGERKGKFRNGFILAHKRRNIHVNRHIIVDEITEAIEAWHKEKWVKIEPIENRHVSIKEETEKTEAENAKSRKEKEKELKAKEKEQEKEAKEKTKKQIEEMEQSQAESESASSIDKDEMKKNLKGESTAKISGNGEDQSSNPLDDVENPEYVEGEEPNFVVNASKSRKGKKGKKNKNSY